jgi:hypothetical protein
MMASLRCGTSASEDFTCIINNFRPPLPVGESREVTVFTGEVENPNNAGQRVQMEGRHRIKSQF